MKFGKHFEKNVVGTDFDQFKAVMDQTDKLQQPLYFYCLQDKNVGLDPGLITPEYCWKHNMQEFYKQITMKYRERLCDENEWNIYPNQDPDNLTNEQVYRGVNHVRGTSDGNNLLSLYRYPPHKNLGPNMRRLLERKFVCKLNLHDPLLADQIKFVDYGYEESNLGGGRLTKQYYMSVDNRHYFEKYDDDASLLFARIPHIVICPKLGFISRDVLSIVKDDKTHKLMSESVKVKYNDKGEVVPDVCKKCGAKIGLYLRGEPVYLCSNEDCGAYYGTAMCE